MSALLGRPLNHRLFRICGLLLTASLGIVASSSAWAQMPYGAARPQYQPQPQQQLRLARQPSQTQSVLRSDRPLAMPLGDGQLAAPEMLDSPASSQDASAKFYEDDLFLISGNCDDAGCCSICGSSGCSGCDPWALFPNCTPPGMLQWLHALHDANGTCWTGQVDAVLFWRNAPPSRELATSSPTGGGIALSALNANELNSEIAGGPRIGIVRKNSCGEAAEFVYLSAGNFRSERTLADTPGFQYEPANVFGNSTQTFGQGTVNLSSGFQTFEANSRTPIGGGSFTFISGFRWLEWRESFTMATNLGPFDYDYSSSVINSLYGGQIGVDAWLLTMRWLQVQSWIKGGAYYNTAVQHTSYQSNVPGEATFSNAISGEPAAGSFVGEVGINGTIPVSSCVNFRFGYTAFWLESIALATQQLTNQNALATNGGTVLQGVNFGFEGNW